MGRSWPIGPRNGTLAGMAVLEKQRGVTARRAALIVVVLAFVAFWIYVFAIADPDPGDRLADQTFPEAAEPICKATLVRLTDAGLTRKKAETPAERADLLEQADVELDRMLGELRAITPTEGEAADAVRKWLEDWEVWMDDRQAWADTLRSTGKDAPFLETGRVGGGGRDGEPMSKQVDHFAAKVNNMPSCATPEAV
jgi:hypothetical protein